MSIQEIGPGNLRIRATCFFLLLFWTAVFFGLKVSYGVAHSATTEPTDRDNPYQGQRLGKQVYIKPGDYYVGSDKETDNKPLRMMTFKGFYIEIHPVTNGQYVEFLSKSHYQPKGTFDMNEASRFPDLPATNLTYEDAAAYAAFFHKRLPTEWEWEIASRSLKKDVVYVSQYLPHNQRGHFLFNKEYSRKPVFSYPPNELGIYGMAGNVFEWTSSKYNERYLFGKYFHTFSLKVLRGGAWTNRALDIRTTTRTPFPASRCLEWIGFRCVRDREVKR
jgi:formylglycine-generating enzyme required for sulfatase activity